jgi:hypothetical protein
MWAVPTALTAIVKRMGRTMASRKISTSRYTALRQGGKALGRLSLWVQVGAVLIGLGLFLDQASGLLSDAQFTWGERRVMGLIALITLGGCGLAGWILSQLFKVSAELLDVMADTAEASWRICDLIEQHLIPSLSRIANAHDSGGSDSARVPRPPVTGHPVDSLRSDLAKARAAGQAGRVMDLRDALTQHLRGDSLHDLDREIALWMVDLVDRRTREGRADAELAGCVGRALDSLGEMPEAERLRIALQTVRHGAGLCPRCGRPVGIRDTVCPDCQRDRAASRSMADSATRVESLRERP